MTRPLLISTHTRDAAVQIAKAKWNVEIHVTTIGCIFRTGGLSRQRRSLLIHREPKKTKIRANRASQTF